MNRANRYLQSMKPYKTASHKIWSVKPEERKSILKLDWNEALQPPSPKVLEALTELLKHPDFFSLYPQTYSKELMEALSRYTSLPEECLQYFAGSDSLHEYIAKVYISAGDPVLILWPSYDNFRLAAEANGARVFYSELPEGFGFCPEKLRADIDSCCPSMVYICNPNNPTGTFADSGTLEEFVRSYPEIMFVVDEAYIEFAGDSVNRLALKYDNVLITHTMSKAFALASFRFGYLVSCAGNISDITKIRNSKGITTFAQEAVIAALDDSGYMRSYANEVICAREWFIEAVNTLFSRKLHAYPSMGNFVLVKCSSQDMKQMLLSGLEERSIFVRNVSQSESLRQCWRITIGTAKQMQRVIEVLKELLS